MSEGQAQFLIIAGTFVVLFFIVCACLVIECVLEWRDRWRMYKARRRLEDTQEIETVEE